MCNFKGFATTKGLYQVYTSTPRAGLIPVADAFGMWVAAGAVPVPHPFVTSARRDRPRTRARGLGISRSRTYAATRRSLGSTRFPPLPIGL